MNKLAINGGRKIRRVTFPAHRVMGREEIRSAQEVLRSGLLSGYLGCWHDNFYGGPWVKKLEKEWAAYFGAKYAIAVNSATSGLFCAVGACGAGPQDEIIVSGYSMSASAIAPLIYNAVPVFADIEPDYFCLDADSIEKKITERTKAIIVVDLFGQPYDAVKVNALAKKYRLAVIEDCAQAPGAKHLKKFCGTLADIGVYSLNYHKHIHTGEGGVIATDDAKLAEKLYLIRNHAEAVIAGKGFTDKSALINMVGFNYRMTELQAAIAVAQLKKLSGLLDERRGNAAYLSQKLSAIPCLTPAKERGGCTHSYYIQPVKFNRKAAGVHRDIFVKAVKAELEPAEGRENEGVRITCGYVKPLYLQPIFQHRIAYGKNNCPWSCYKEGLSVNYGKGICPVTESMYEDLLITHEYVYPGMKKKDLDDIAGAFGKVYDNRGELMKGASMRKFKKAVG